ncbi:hypothetical protein WN55_09629 [Dufourea novaeangliae]|uniref:Uncharacterized protein n=1 Tax=Dufourea novaeangliae TaxID=178035 RepID=A0A154P121_DUFNO|nr:hypothetical protein WN55_09629 [Dufourea novaeangliae]
MAPAKPQGSSDDLGIRLGPKQEDTSIFEGKECRLRNHKLPTRRYGTLGGVQEQFVVCDPSEIDGIVEWPCWGPINSVASDANEEKEREHNAALGSEMNDGKYDSTRCSLGPTSGHGSRQPVVMDELRGVYIGEGTYGSTFMAYSCTSLAAADMKSQSSTLHPRHVRH